MVYGVVFDLCGLSMPIFTIAEYCSCVCKTYTEDCLGSFCDVAFVPPICSPKTIQQVTTCMVYAT
ncbi:hypothetical protein EON63_10180 [archaeon]|nr:MAG: hypothetical protein EON63_10180 [archaeon]